MSGTGFFHASWDELPVGTVLEGRRQIDAPIERLFESVRRSSAPNHAQAVFMVRDLDDLPKVGGGGNGPYVYEVEPTDAVSGPYDGGWYNEVAMMHVREYRGEQDLTKRAPLVRMVLKYWDGKKLDMPGPYAWSGTPGSWEYLAEGARVVRRVR